jgi:hypothetical protein
MFWKNLWAVVTGAAAKVWAFIRPILAAHGASLTAAALPIALEIVRSFEDDPADGVAKRDLAAARLRDTLVREGLATYDDLSASLLNWFVETALRRLKTEPSEP